MPDPNGSKGSSRSRRGATTHDQPLPIAERELESWLKDVRCREQAHKLAEARFSRRSRGLGLFVTILSAAVGTTLFTTLSSAPSTAQQLVAAGFSLAATLAAAIQTFMGYGQLAAEHHTAEAKFWQLRRAIESVKFRGIDPKMIEDWKAKWNTAEESEPDVPEDIEQEADQTVRHPRQRRKPVRDQDHPAVPSVMG